MSVALLIAIAISVFAVGAAVVVLRRFDGWRFGFLAATTTFMTTFVAVLILDRIVAVEMLPGLSLDEGSAEFALVGLATMTLLSVVLLERVIRVQRESARAVQLHQFSVERAAISAMWIGPDGRILNVNQRTSQSLGYSKDELRAKSIWDIDPNLSFLAWHEHWARLKLKGALTFESEHRTKTGETVMMEVTENYLKLDGQEYNCTFARDITAQKLQQKALEHQALHDGLTGLPNRTLLADRLTHALRTAKRDGKPLALLLLDLDRFKEVNDTLGHQVGDVLLCEAARRLATAVRGSDTIARLGGDEFAALLPAVTDLERARRVAKRIIAALEPPFEVVDGLSLEVGVSIGIAMFPDHAEDATKLLTCADVAMYTSKQSHAHIALYEPEKDYNSVRHLTLTGQLRQAIEQNQLSFHYQPKIDLKTMQLCGVEALARWHHPRHGFIPPDEFVPQAERTGLIEPLTRWSFETALGQLAAWRDQNLAITMSVNLSARSLQERQLPDRVARMLSDWNVEPSALILEITESAIMVDPETALDVVTRLHDIGVRLSIDDFGTGYSSLAYLKRLPIDELKIDQSFVKHMAVDQNDRVIVRSTIDLAHNLGLKVVAEGIDEEQHVALLSLLGCDVGQGFFISEPLTIEAFSAWLRAAPWEPARDPAPKSPMLRAAAVPSATGAALPPVAAGTVFGKGR